MNYEAYIMRIIIKIYFQIISIMCMILNVKTNRTNSQCDMGNIINIRCRAIQDINIFLGQGYYGQFACHLTVLGSKIDGSVI